MASAIERAPVETWESILDWVMYEDDTFTLCLEHPSSLAGGDVQLRALRNQLYILRCVCRAWNEYASRAFKVVSRIQNGNEGLRFTSRNHFMDEIVSEWEDVIPDFQNHNWTYFDGCVGGKENNGRHMLDTLLPLLAQHHHLQYLNLEQLYPTPLPSYSRLIHFPRVSTLALAANSAFPVDHIMLLDLPSLHEMVLILFHGDITALTDINTILQKFGPQLQALSFQPVRNLEDVIALPSVLWEYLPKLEHLSLRGCSATLSLPTTSHVAWNLIRSMLDCPLTRLCGSVIQDIIVT